VFRILIGRPVAALCLCLLALGGCEQQRGQPGPKPISGNPSADMPSPAATGASGAPSAPR